MSSSSSLGFTGGSREMAEAVSPCVAQRSDEPGCPRSDANGRARVQGRPRQHHLRGIHPAGGGSQRKLLLGRSRYLRWPRQVVGDVLRTDGLLAEAALEGSAQSILSVLLQQLVQTIDVPDPDLRTLVRELGQVL